MPGGFASSKGRLLFPLAGRSEVRPAKREGTDGPGLEIKSTLGAPVRAHTVVELSGAGSLHSGRYLVAAVRHLIDPAGHRMTVELVRNAWGT